MIGSGEGVVMTSDMAKRRQGASSIDWKTEMMLERLLIFIIMKWEGRYANLIVFVLPQSGYRASVTPFIFCLR